MQWYTQYRDRYKWHPWFAWHPVIVNHWDVGGYVVQQKVWLKKIKRRFVGHYAGDDIEYRL